MLRTALLLTCLAANPLHADVVAALFGQFGTSDPPEETCARNPMTQIISPDQRRIRFHWAEPVQSYTGAMITDFGGSIIHQDATSLTFLRDAETRRDPSGALILWTMHLLPHGAYCYTSTGWPDAGCGPSYLPCRGDPALS